MRDHRQPDRAAAADDVSGAPGERQQLTRERRLAPPPDVEATSGSPARIGGAREIAQTRVLADAAVLDRGAGHVQDPCVRAQRAQPFLPLLLVAAVLERHVERPHAFERAAADRHVRAPREARVGVLVAQLERRDRRVLAPAAVRCVAVQARPDRPREHVHVRVLPRGIQQRVQPAIAGAHVVVDEHHELAVRVLHAAVAGDVQAESARVREVAGTEARRQLLHGRRATVVVDDQHLGCAACSGRCDRAQGHLQVGQACARRDHYRGSWSHDCQRV